MSEETVMQAIADFLAPPNVTRLDAVYPNFPAKILNQGGTFNFPVGANSHGWGVLFNEHDEERRITTCDDEGEKEVIYRVRLELLYRSRSDAETAQREFRELKDALKTRFRSNRTLGSNVIFEAGEGQYGIQGDYLEPVANDTDKLVVCAGTVRLEVVEHVIG